MRRIITCGLVAIALSSATGCRGCLDRICRFERAKNEALFGWMRKDPQPVQPEVCADPYMMHSGAVTYGYGGFNEQVMMGSPTIGGGACCQETTTSAPIAAPGILPTPAPGL